MTGASAGSAERRLPHLVFGIVLAVVGWLTIVPLGMLFYSTVSAGKNILPFEATELSLANYATILTDPATYILFGNTAVFTIGATAIGVGVAVLFAWLIERTDMWWRPFFFAAILVPMAIPNMIYAMSWIQLLNPNNGLINATLRNLDLEFIQFNVYTLGGMIFVQGIAMASHAYLLVAASFRLLDPSWEEQSLIAGKRVFATLRRVTLPVLKPALLAATIFFAVVAMETFDIPVTLGLNSKVHVLSTRIYWASHPETGGLPDYGTAATLSMLLLVVACFMIALYSRQTRHAKQFVTVTGRGYRPQRMALGAWRLPLFIGALLFVVVAVVLPLFILVWRSFLRFYIYPSADAVARLNLNAYRNVLFITDFPEALTNTVVMAVAAGLIAVFLASLVAWLVVRGAQSSRWRRSLNIVAFLPQAVPSVVMGLAILFVYLWLPVGIYGTVWILVLAMVTRYLAYATGMMIASQMQISAELEEASRIAGAHALRTYIRIVMPLIAPALFACFLWVIIHVVRELALALMLYSSESQVLSTKIWLFWEGGKVAEAAAVGVITVLSLLVLLALPWIARKIWRLVRRPPAPVLTEARA